MCVCVCVLPPLFGSKEGIRVLGVEEKSLSDVGPAHGSRREIVRVRKEEEEEMVEEEASHGKDEQSQNRGREEEEEE